MGKGSNVQKKQQAQMRNLKDRGKSDEERKAAAAKAKYVAADLFGMHVCAVKRVCEHCSNTLFSLMFL
jgi:hypothetical protein